MLLIIFSVLFPKDNFLFASKKIPMGDEKLDDTSKHLTLNDNEFFDECVACEEFSAIPELLSNSDDHIESTKSTLHQRRYDIYQRLIECIEVCVRRFRGRKELATDDDEGVNELCDILEEAFQYGLRQHQPKFIVSAALLFQNMQEIVIGTSPFNALTSNVEVHFWDFCQCSLTSHEKHYYEHLSNVWTKRGYGRAFIRTMLNEHSLQRYILIWLANRNDLNTYYTHWSLLMDDKLSGGLINIIKSLDDVLFALNVNKTELNAESRNSIGISEPSLVSKAEPTIYAPEPTTVNRKAKGKVKPVERPIVTLKCTENRSQELQHENLNSMCDVAKINEFKQAVQDLLTPLNNTSSDDIQQYLPTFCKFTDKANENSASSASSLKDGESDSSSGYSKSPKSEMEHNIERTLNKCNLEQHKQLEQQLKEANELCTTLNTRVAKLKLENLQLTRRLKKFFFETGVDPSSSFATNFLITIPQALLSSSGYYMYDVHITMRQNLEHWSLLRRYNDFNKLHKTLLKTHPSVLRVEFPPKKRFGNKNPSFVEERRQQLQIYLLNLVETLPQLEACKSKTELQKVFPFLRDS